MPGGGEQLDVRNITRADGGELSAEQVAGYIAKYATKATESLGAGLDRRLGADDLEHLDRLPAHVVVLVGVAWELGGRPELEGLRLRAWAHMLGFGGHWSTKSRRYSTTMGALRPWVLCVGPGSPSPSAAGLATAFPWMPSDGPRTTRP
jgi:hypothetical protein